MRLCTVSHVCVLIFLNVFVLVVDRVQSQHTKVVLSYDAKQKPVLECECKNSGECNSEDLVKVSSNEK